MAYIRVAAAVLMMTSWVTGQATAATAATAATPTLQIPPPMPSVWPSIDQTIMIDTTAGVSTDPLVVNAIAYVNAVVNATLLAIVPSVYNASNPSTPTYTADVNANCYWPYALCMRNKTANFNADVNACPAANTWGLTYDDGPTVNLVNGVHTDDTADIRNNLAAINTTATFFAVGSNVIQQPAELAASYAAGHEIAVHTWTHHPLTALTNEQIVMEIKYAEAIIYQSIGVVPNLFRPPYGDIDDRVRAILYALGYTTVIWQDSRDSTDADQTNTLASTAATIVATVESWFVAQPGFVSLEHDISTFTSGIAVTVLQAIKAAGASFPLKLSRVGACIGVPSYRYSNVTGFTNGTTTASASPSSSPSSSNVPAMPSSTTTAPTPSPSHSVKISNDAGGVAGGLLTNVLLPGAVLLAAAGL